MKKFKIVFNLITVALTTGLLVIITLAWYAVNKTANVTAGTGMVASQTKLVDQVDYYRFSSVSTENGITTYTFENGDHIMNSGTLNMNEYSFNAAAPTIYYIRIKLKNDISINQIRFISAATAFVGYSTRVYPDPNNAGENITCEDANGVIVGTNKHLSLSSAIRFAYLGCSGANAFVDANNNSAVFANIESYTWNNFSYSSSGAITQSSVNVLPSAIPDNGDRYIHLLLDYDVLHLNEFYGNNLSNQNVLNPAGGTGPEFSNTDFTIYLLA